MEGDPDSFKVLSNCYRIFWSRYPLTALELGWQFHRYLFRPSNGDGIADTCSSESVKSLLVILSRGTHRLNTRYVNQGRQRRAPAAVSIIRCGNFRNTVKQFSVKWRKGVSGSAVGVGSPVVNLASRLGDKQENETKRSGVQWWKFMCQSS
jgi:hypothetical protein